MTDERGSTTEVTEFTEKTMLQEFPLCFGASGTNKVGP
jgi:hypothetical protein